MAVDSPALLNGVSVEDRHFRQLLRAALGGSPLAFAGGVGVDNRGAHGVGGNDHLVVTQSASPGMSVDVSAGIAAITGTQSVNQGPFPFWNNAPVTLTIAAAHATQTRRDLIIAQIPTDGSPPRLDRVTGTPHPTTPVDPSLATYPNALVLARVVVPGGASSILNANITRLAGLVGTARHEAQLTQRLSEATATLRHTPGGVTDVAAGPSVLATLGNVVVPLWATSASVVIAVSTLTWTSPPATHLLAVGIGSVVGSPDSIIESNAVRQPRFWISRLTGLTPGTHALTARATRSVGAGSIRSDTGSIWTAEVAFKP